MWIALTRLSLLDFVVAINSITVSASVGASETLV